MASENATLTVGKEQIVTQAICTIAASLILISQAPCQDRRTDALDPGLEALYKTKDYDKAIDFFTKSMGRDALTRSFCYCCRGIAYHKKGVFEEAIADLTKAIQINPDLYLAYMARGDVFYSDRRFRVALSDYNEAIRLNPKKSVMYLNRGLIRYELKQYDCAIEDYSKAIRLQPQYVDAYIARGNTFHALRSNQKAIADYSKALEYAPRNYRALHNRGIVYHDSQSYKLAIRDFSQAIKNQPDNPLGYYNLAWELATSPQDDARDGKKAVELAKRGCELSKWKNLSYYTVLAASYAERGDYDLAVKWESKALDNPAFKEQFGDRSLVRLALYKNHQPYRDKPSQDNGKKQGG